MLFKLSKLIRKILCELYGFFFLNVHVKRNNEMFTTPHISARKFSLFHFSTQKIIILFEKVYIIPDKGNRYSITSQKRALFHYSKTKFSYSHFNIPVQSLSLCYWQCMHKI